MSLGEKGSTSKFDIATSVNSLRNGKNPCNKNNVPSKCVICRSILHWSMDCPDQSIHKVNIDPGGLEQLQRETSVNDHNSVVVSTEVSKSVCGRPWLLSYMETLAPHVRSGIVETPSSTDFYFGNVGRLTAYSKCIIPLDRVGKKTISVEVELVQTDIPLMLSRATLKRGNAKIDPHTDTMMLSGKMMYLNHSQSGLYYIMLSGGLSQNGKELHNSGDDSYNAPQCDLHLHNSRNNPDVKCFQPRHYIIDLT